MNQPETTQRDQVELTPPPPTPVQKACASGAAQPAKKKKLSLEIEEIGEALERKISP